MNKTLYVCIGLIALMMACSKSEKETPSGLKYIVLAAGDGKVANPSEIIVFDWQIKDSNDSVWQQTFGEGLPSAAQIADTSQLRMEDGLTQMLRMLSKGDSVKAEMSIVEYFSKSGGPLPPGVDSTLSVAFTIKVRNVLPEGEFQAYMDEEMKKREVKIFNKDTAEISKFLSDKNLTARVDTSGLQYILHNSKGGQKPSVDDCVQVKYRGSFLKTGEVFQEADNISFPLNGVIPGWKLAIPLLGKGDSGTFYIPSKLAYGPQGYPGAIPADAILIFDVTLLDVKDTFDQATGACK